MNIGRESEILEFKKSTSELKSAIKSISAILNKHNSGTLYFGVKDDGRVCGQQIGNDTLRDVSRSIRNYIKPECEFEVNLKHSYYDKEFIEVVFNGNREPYAADGRYYIRFADQDRQMTPDELEMYFRKKQKNYSKWEEEDSLVKITDVDDEILEFEVNQGYENKRLPFKYNDTKSILKKLGLLFDGKDTLNNAGNVLFSKNKPVLLKLAVFATETKDTFIKLEHFKGNIYECINKGMKHILEEINWNILFDGSPKRKEEPEIPHQALREIVINAFCHSDYNSNTALEISVFKDRVTIYSPGFFPSGLTPEDFALEREKPIMLNPLINNVLYKTCEIESFGYGFESTFKICNERDIKYKYENTRSGFRFTFYRQNYVEYKSDLSDVDKSVLDIIKKDNYIKVSEISEKLDKSDKTIYRSIKKLKEKKLIERIGNNNSGYWDIL